MGNNFRIPTILAIIIVILLQAIDSGQLPMWANLPAPDVAIKYWKLPVSDELAMMSTYYFCHSLCPVE